MNAVSFSLLMTGVLLNAGEWWLDDLAHALQVPQQTLYRWVRRGWAHATQLLGHHGRWVLWADEE